MSNPCSACNGEGFIDLGADARTCAVCNGTGEENSWLRTVRLNDARVQMLFWMFGQAQRVKPFNRRLGRPATAREIIAFAHDLGLEFADRKEAPHEPQTTDAGQRPPQPEEALPGTDR